MSKFKIVAVIRVRFWVTTGIFVKQYDCRQADGGKHFTGKQHTVVISKIKRENIPKNKMNIFLVLFLTLSDQMYCSVLTVCCYCFVLLINFHSSLPKCLCKNGLGNIWVRFWKYLQLRYDNVLYEHLNMTVFLIRTNLLGFHVRAAYQVGI